MATTMIEQLTGFAYLLGWKLVRVLPEKFAYRIFERLADRSSRKRKVLSATARESPKSETGHHRFAVRSISCCWHAQLPSLLV